MDAAGVPDRLRSAVDALDHVPADHVLEIGCGPGLALALVADRLTTGRVTGLDRSAVAISRAAARNADRIAAGRVALLRSDLADFAGSAERFDLIFAIRVNLFWTRPPPVELAVVEELMRPSARLHLFWDEAGDKAARVRDAVVRAVVEQGFVEVLATGADGVHVACRRKP